jgi:FkbM family methyltransferase
MPAHPAAVPPDCYVYGTGSFAAEMVTQLGAINCRVLGQVDRLHRPGVASSEPDDPSLDRDVPVLIGVCNPHVNISDVMASLRAIGFHDIWSPVRAALGIGRSGGRLDCYWLTSDASVYVREAASVARARGLFSDEASLRIFDDVVAYRRTGEIREFTVEPVSEQYLARGFDFPRGPVRLLDCGAYDGDTIRTFLDAGVDLEAVIACEPDLTNFGRLTVSSESLAGVEITPLPVALADETRLKRFSANAEASARLESDGDRQVLAVRGDELMRDWRPTHIKMDIEGAEPAALSGLQITLKEERPHLAISVYHLPDHMWSIPLWLSAMDLGYEFVLRCYGHQTFDVVLYAVPPAVSQG